MIQQPNKVISSKLVHLASDLSHIYEPGFLESLAPAPLVSEWFVAPHPGLHLRGNVVGHPKLNDGPFESSELWYINEELKLARTLSRWFRLGTPLMGRR